MASVIESFFVQLGLDVTTYQKGVKDASAANKRLTSEITESNKKTEEQARKLAASMGSLKRELLAIVGLSLGVKGTFDAIRNQVNAQAQLGRSAKDIGMNAKELASWGKVMEQVGGSAKSFEGTIGSVISGIQAFKSGDVNNQTVATLSLIGVEIGKYTDEMGNMTDATGLYLDIADKMASRSRQDQASLAERIGIDKDALEVMRLGRTEITKRLEEMRKATQASEESAAASAKLAAEIAKLKNEFFGLGEGLYNKAIPALEQVVSLTRDIIGFFKEADTATNGWSTTLAALATAAAGIASAVGSIAALKAVLGIGGGAAAAAGAGGSAAGGVGLAAGAAGLGFAGLAGVGVGAAINKYLLSDDAKTTIGRGVAKVAAFFGSDDAKAALDAEARGSESLRVSSGGVKQQQKPKQTESKAAVEAFARTASEASGVPYEAIRTHVMGETGKEGTKAIGRFNFANIKADKRWKGDVVEKMVPEFINGQWVQQMAKFRSYQSPEESAKDYIGYLGAGRHKGALSAKTTTGFFESLKRSGYATDPNYVEKMVKFSRTFSPSGAGFKDMPSMVGAGGQRSGGNTTTVTTQVNGPVTIVTQSKDPQGVKQALIDGVSTQSRLSVATTGLN